MFRALAMEEAIMTKIFSTRPLPHKLSEQLALRGDFSAWSQPEPMDDDAISQLLCDVDGLITPDLRIDEARLRLMPRLRAVSTISVGYDHFDIDAMLARGVIGTHTPSVLDDSVADLTFLLMLATARRLVEMHHVVTSGAWRDGRDDLLMGVDVHHRTLGIVGMGRIGEAVAKRASLGFGMNVLYHNRTRREQVERDYGAQYVSFDDVLALSDFVVLLTPLTDSTRDMMNREAFAKMKRTAIFINVSRGATVDEQALYDAIVQGQILGAGLDVFREEPVPINHPLLTLPNVVVSPHIGSATLATRMDMAELAIHNLIATLDGRYDDAKIVPELQTLAKGRAE